MLQRTPRATGSRKHSRATALAQPTPSATGMRTTLDTFDVREAARGEPKTQSAGDRALRSGCVRPNDSRVSCAALIERDNVRVHLDAKIALILRPRSGVGYTRLLGRGI